MTRVAPDAPARRSLLGDARRGKLADNVVAFARALRRAGVPLDAARIALAQQALQCVGVERRGDVGAALEAVVVSREQDRAVFRELFDAYFRNPNVAQKLLAQMLPSAESKAEPVKRRPRVSEALAPVRAARNAPPAREEDKIECDAAMTASDLQRLKQADFNQLSASEFHLVERLAPDHPGPDLVEIVARGNAADKVPELGIVLVEGIERRREGVPLVHVLVREPFGE